MCFSSNFARSYQHRVPRYVFAIPLSHALATLITQAVIDTLLNFLFKEVKSRSRSLYPL